MHEGRRQTNTGPAHAGSRLKLSDALGRRRPKCHPSSRTGENPPYGMIGGIEETSASFEARSAPRSYPTAGGVQQWASLPRSSVEPSGSIVAVRTAGIGSYSAIAITTDQRRGRWKPDLWLGAYSSCRSIAGVGRAGGQSGRLAAAAQLRKIA